MEIEAQKEFQKIKDVRLGRMAYSEEHDMILWVPWSLKRIVLVRFSTDEIVLKHHLGVNAVISAMRRIDRGCFFVFRDLTRTTGSGWT